MGLAITLYSGLMLVALLTCIYSIWCYYECPTTRSHRPYVFPIFVSIGWFVLSLNGIMAYATRTQRAPDGFAFILLATATMVALLIFLSHYRRGRQCEIKREAHSVQSSD